MSGQKNFFCEIDALMFKQLKIPLYWDLQPLTKNPNFNPKSSNSQT